MSYGMKRRHLGPAWIRDDRETLTYPENGHVSREVFRNFFTGGVIVRRYNAIGELISTNEDEQLFGRRTNFIVC